MDRKDVKFRIGEHIFRKREDGTIVWCGSDDCKEVGYLIEKIETAPTILEAEGGSDE